MSDDPGPRTFPEMLDAATSGEEFGDAVLGLFRFLERAREDD